VTLKESQPATAFKLSDDSTQRRLGYVQDLCCTPDASELGDLKESAKLAMVEAHA